MCNNPVLAKPKRAAAEEAAISSLSFSSLTLLEKDPSSATSDTATPSTSPSSSWDSGAFSAYSSPTTQAACSELTTLDGGDRNYRGSVGSSPPFSSSLSRKAACGDLRLLAARATAPPATTAMVPPPLSVRNYNHSSKRRRTSIALQQRPKQQDIDWGYFVDTPDANY